MMKSLVSERQRRLAREGDAILRHPDGAKARHLDFGSEPTALFVHGFTADAGYMVDIMDAYEGAGFRVFSFDYECFEGIDVAAASLCRLLRLFDTGGSISGNRIVIVAHSMGGLVARALVTIAGGGKFVKKVLTLGSPHNGTLNNNRMLTLFLQWAEAVGGVNPASFKSSRRSAQQLIGADSDNFLERLKNTPPDCADVQFLSLSGGYPKLEFGKNALANLVANNWLQSNLSTPNDGLVSESSSDLSNQAFCVNCPRAIHFGSYREHARVNHTNLVNNQSVALAAVEVSR